MSYLFRPYGSSATIGDSQYIPHPKLGILGGRVAMAEISKIDWPNALGNRFFGLLFAFFSGLFMSLAPGLYRHYKGNNYQVFQVATHSETREQLVVYRCLYDDFSWWVRPLSMFIETVEIAGEVIPRFQFVRELSNADLAAYPPVPGVGQK